MRLRVLMMLLLVLQYANALCCRRGATGHLCHRCWTQQLATKGGGKVAVDLGAGWAHGITTNPLVALAGKAKVALAKKPTDFENGIIYLPDGSPASTAQEDK